MALWRPVVNLATLGFYARHAALDRRVSVVGVLELAGRQPQRDLTSVDDERQRKYVARMLGNNRCDVLICERGRIRLLSYAVWRPSNCSTFHHHLEASSVLPNQLSPGS